MFCLLYLSHASNNLTAFAFKLLISTPIPATESYFLACFKIFKSEWKMRNKVTELFEVFFLFVSVVNLILKTYMSFVVFSFLAFLPLCSLHFVLC